LLLDVLGHLKADGHLAYRLLPTGRILALGFM
jgi:hypothetical protein